MAAQLLGIKQNVCSRVLMAALTLGICGKKRLRAAATEKKASNKSLLNAGGGGVPAFNFMSGGDCFTTDISIALSLILVAARLA